MKTTLRQNVTNTDRNWYMVDAAGKTLGQLSVVIANTLRGKHRVDFTPHVDGGDYVVVLNADKISVTGNKESDKLYHRHSGYIGNLKTQTLADVREKDPLRIMQHSVSGMLPKTKLRAAQMKRLILVIGDQNPHAAQNPEPLKF
ncbi:50S ribosomal protein L13 [bacterium]|jgi:large subunit ribosomal protein L13|nr:50S ribosomal protein L13 [bacterium]MBT6831989.1 50S ribosomal protein L13 [bacterium]MBT6996789.1 50S ribosomal protein L13 [bacterium]MBT7772086.1 50S ribosomal protein L13 [bacterium]